MLSATLLPIHFFMLVLYHLSYVAIGIQGYEISPGDSAVVEAFSDIVISCSYGTVENQSLLTYDGQEISWFFNNIEISLVDPRFNVTAKNFSSTLLISGATFADSGLYSCKLPDLEENLSTQITVGTSPEKPENFECSTRNTIEFYCTWSSVTDTNLDITYTFEYKSIYDDDDEWNLCPDLQDNLCYIDTRRDDVPVKSGNIEMRVSATNALGSEDVTIVFNPDKKVMTNPPTNLIVEAISSSEIQLTFHKPDDTAYLFFLVYKVRYHTEWAPEQIVELSEKESYSTETKYPLIGTLESYTNHTFQVSCKVSGAYGIWSDWSKPSSGKTFESMPSQTLVIYKVEPTVGSENLLRDVKIYWQPLAERDKHGVILHNKISINQVSDNVTKDNTTFLTYIDPSLTDYTFSDLLIYDSYNITIKACNSVACSSPAIYLLGEDVDKPSEPQNAIAQPLSKSSVKLTWDEPGEPNGLIEGYRVEYLQSDNLGVVHYLETVQLKVIMEDLESFTLYYFSVQARTKIGYGGFSPRITEKTLEDAPDAPPQNLEVVAFNQDTLELSWEPPLDKNQRGEIVGYTVYYCLTNELNDLAATTHFVKNQSVNGSAQSASLVGLEENRNYTIWMSASTAVGEGPITERIQAFTMVQLTNDANQELQALKTGLVIGVTVGVAIVATLLLVLAFYRPVLLKKIESYLYIADPQLPYPDSSDVYPGYVNDFDSWTGDNLPKYTETFDTPLYFNKASLSEEKKQKDDLANSCSCSADACETCQIQQTSGHVACKTNQSDDGSEVVIKTQTSVLSDVVFMDCDKKTKIDDTESNEEEEVLRPQVRISSSKRGSGESSSSNDSYNYLKVGDSGNLVPLVPEEDNKGEAGFEKDIVDSEKQRFPKAQSRGELFPEHSSASPVGVMNLSEEQVNLPSMSGDSEDYVPKDKLPPVVAKELPRGYSVLSHSNRPDFKVYIPISRLTSYCGSDVTGSSDSSGYVTQGSLSPDYGSNSGYSCDSDTESSDISRPSSSPAKEPFWAPHSPTAILPPLDSKPDIDSVLKIAINEEDHFLDPTLNSTDNSDLSLPKNALDTSVYPLYDPHLKHHI